ncbi:glycosyltransferase [uncultured Pedobacter sp.]|uniref:glycosyltransferase n=1 Tax=uncultured Pedobacter sp. TaxID=246139 RepID=UPI0025CDB3DE|nr:glycosyltransferase [uncultured Pedobacter sp.]
MRVLHIINSLGVAGAEKLLVDALPRYKNFGVEASLLCLNGKRTIFYDTLSQNFDGKIMDLGKGSLYNPLHIFRLKKLLKNFDVVHVHLFPSLYWVAIAKFLFRLKVPLLFTEHSTNNRRIDHLIFRMIDRLIYRFYNGVFAITPAVKLKLVEQLNYDTNHCHVVYNGIDVEAFKNAIPYPKSEFFEDPNAVLLIQTSRFQREKDQKTVIKALALLPNRFKLLLVGDGELKAECVELVSRLNLKERVLFLGVRADIPNLIKTADVVVQSSNWEGFGLTAVEGMAAGKPVVASNVNGLNAIVESYGLLFNARDEQMLASCVEQLMTDPEFYRETAKKCAQRADHFGLDKMLAAQIEVYKTVLIHDI